MIPVFTALPAPAIQQFAYLHISLVRHAANKYTLVPLPSQVPDTFYGVVLVPGQDLKRYSQNGQAYCIQFGTSAIAQLQLLQAQMPPVLRLEHGQPAHDISLLYSLIVSLQNRALLPAALQNLPDGTWLLALRYTGNNAAFRRQLPNMGLSLQARVELMPTLPTTPTKRLPNTPKTMKKTQEPAAWQTLKAAWSAVVAQLGGSTHTLSLAEAEEPQQEVEPAQPTPPVNEPKEADPSPSPQQAEESPGPTAEPVTQPEQPAPPADPELNPHYAELKAKIAQLESQLQQLSNAPAAAALPVSGGVPGHADGHLLNTLKRLNGMA